MSHTIKILKGIAAGEEYKSLCAAIEIKDYQALYTAYTKLSQVLKDAGKEVEGKLDSLPRQNKGDDLQKFQKAFEARAQAVLPQWYFINSQIKKQNVLDGVVVSIGKMGDPMTRTPAGKLVVLTGSKAKEGDKVTYTIVSEGQKLSFGRQFELTPDTFYFLLNQEVHQKVKDSLDTVQKKLESYPGTDDAENISQMDEMLKMLEGVIELTSKMMNVEKEKTLSQVAICRRRVLGPIVEKLALDSVSKEEEKAIKELCGGDEAKLSAALAAPGLFSPLSFNAFKERLFDGDKIRGYEGLLAEQGKNIDTMDAALKFEELKSSIDELQPKVQFYVDGMERLFKRLNFRARQLANSISTDKVSSAEAVIGKMKEAFSEKELGDELQYVFHSAEEYFDSRGTTMNLRARLGDAQCATAEAILKPYLRQKVNSAFAKRSYRQDHR